MNLIVRAYRASLSLPVEQRNARADLRSGLAASLSSSVRSDREVLRDIDFCAEDGDRVAVVGLNGAGKTTLLRLLNGAYAPTSGVVKVRGTTQSLLNPMLGFLDQASVVENIYLRGTAMGLRLRQLRAVAEEILDFAGLTDQASLPLQVLSSGQRMRLGFSISTAVQPDILFMDEWLSTGDASFVSRAKRRMTDRFEGSRIVMLASHSTSLLRNTCTKALVLDQGQMAYFGDIEEGLATYRDIVAAASVDARDVAVGMDPLLFGQSAGVLERIRCAGGVLEVEGWAVDERGREVEVLCVDLDGERHVLDNVRRTERTDVQHYLGKSSGAFGFQFSLPAVSSAEAGRGVLERLRVSAGRTADRLGASLPFLKAGTLEDN